MPKGHVHITIRNALGLLTHDTATEVDDVDGVREQLHEIVPLTEQPGWDLTEAQRAALDQAARGDEPAALAKRTKRARKPKWT